MSARLTASTACFHYAATGQRCRATCLDPAAFCCATHLHEYQHTPTARLLNDAAESIFDCTRFTKQGLPFLACRRLSSWKRLCNALHALSFQGYHDQAELLTLLVGSIESIRGPWQGKSGVTRKGKSFERLVTRLYLEELAPLVGAAPSSNQDSVHVSWDEKLSSLPGRRRQIDVLLRRRSAKGTTLTVVECRDHEVEVGEMDAFVTLVRHVGASQGVLVSSEGFQKGAEECARFEGIETRVVTEEDFSAESTERVVDPIYALEPLMMHIEPPNGRPPVLLTVPPERIHVVRNGVIVETLVDLVRGLVATQAPVPGSMPPRIDVMTPGFRLLLPDDTSLDMAAIHIPVKVVGQKTKCTLLLPRRALSFSVRQPLLGVARKVVATNVPLFPSSSFEAGRFYVNLMGQAYHCDAVSSDSTIAHLVLLNDQQHEGGPLDVEFDAGFDQAEHFHPVEDPKAIGLLRADLARFRSFAVPRNGA